MSPRMVNVLLIEDNEIDARMVLRAAENSKLRNRVLVATDGQSGLEILRDAERREQDGAIDLVLLDLNLPGITGVDVLAEIKNDLELRLTPVVILTTSSDEKDIADAYANHAAAFITKPVGFDGFMKVVQSVEQFWVEIVKLPDR